MFRKAALLLSESSIVINRIGPMIASEKLAICATSAFALVVALTPAAKALALRFNLVAPPCGESGHTEPTPVLGGIAIVFAVIAALGLVGELPRWLTAGMVALLAVGVMDDAVALTPLRKLLAQVMVVAFFSLGGRRLRPRSRDGRRSTLPSPAFSWSR